MKSKKKVLGHIFLKKDDITKEKSDAIVNAANPSLLGGGGVDGAIHRAAGPGLLKECRKIGKCNHGEARITKGYNLNAKYVIHTPGPIYKNEKEGEKDILTNSYINSLMIAKQYNIKSISFPSISTGVYNYPKNKACKVAITSAIDFMINQDYILDIIFVLYDDENLLIYKNQLAEIKNELY